MDYFYAGFEIWTSSIYSINQLKIFEFYIELLYGHSLNNFFIFKHYLYFLTIEVILIKNQILPLKNLHQSHPIHIFHIHTAILYEPLLNLLGYSNLPNLLNPSDHSGLILLFQILGCKGPRDHSANRLSGTGSASSRTTVNLVFAVVGEIGVPRTRNCLEMRIVGLFQVQVIDQSADGRAQGKAVLEPGLDC